MTPEGTASRPRRRDADENLDALLDAAAQVLADDPAAGVAEIAAAAGLGRVTAWRHLGSREELLGRLHDRAVADVKAALAETLGDGVPAAADVGRAVPRLAEIGTYYRALFLTDPGGLLKHRRREGLAPLTDAIRRGQRAGTLGGGLPPAIAAELVAATVHAAVVHGADRPRERKKAVDGARVFAERALAPPSS